MIFYLFNEFDFDANVMQVLHDEHQALLNQYQKNMYD